MDFTPKQSQVWRKFKKAVESKGFVMITATDQFKKQIYDSFIEKYRSNRMTVEEFAGIMIVVWNTTPHRAIDNIGGQYMGPTLMKPKD